MLHTSHQLNKYHIAYCIELPRTPLQSYNLNYIVFFISFCYIKKVETDRACGT